MIHDGPNVIDGLPVDVARKCCRRFNLRVDAKGGVHLTVPCRWASLHEGEAFLRAKWAWVLQTRQKILARPPVVRAPPTEAEIERLRALLTELNGQWAAFLNETDVQWKIRLVKSVWGCCHWRKRYITYNAELARAPRELVEYVVVHEFTHFAVHGHGPMFWTLMDARLPGWQTLRKRLNERDWETPASAPPAVQPVEPPAAPPRQTFVQGMLPGF